MSLLPQQIESKIKLAPKKVGAFFMEPGTGKTRPVFELVRDLNPDCVVWFTPFQTKENLRLELSKWGKHSIHIEGIESIQNSDRIYLEIHNKLENAVRPVLVVDESLKIKNSDAQRTKRIHTLSALVEFKYILNGTPISRNLLDLWSQFQFLSPSILKMTETQFKNNFCEYKSLTIHNASAQRSRTKEWIVRYHNLDYLYALIEPYVFESDLSIEVKKQYINIDFELQPEEKTAHEEIIEKILDNEWLMAKPNFFLELTQKLQNNYSRSEEKFRFVREIIKANNPKEILIYAKYIATQEQLQKEFPNIQILSYKKHSFGLNLQQYNHTIFFDKIWDYALREQAERRTYRTGQTQECFYYDLTGNVGLEKMINNNIARKADLLREFKKLSLEQFREKVK